MAVKRMQNDVASSNFQHKLYRVVTFKHSNLFQTTTVIYTDKNLMVDSTSFYGEPEPLGISVS